MGETSWAAGGVYSLDEELTLPYVGIWEGVSDQPEGLREGHQMAAGKSCFLILGRTSQLAGIDMNDHTSIHPWPFQNAQLAPIR